MEKVVVHVVEKLSYRFRIEEKTFFNSSVVTIGKTIVTHWKYKVRFVQLMMLTD